MTEVQKWLQTIKAQGILPEENLRKLCDKAKEVLVRDSNV
jgi:hypothetical protein